MFPMKSLLAVLLSCAMAQSGFGQAQSLTVPATGGFFSRFTTPYRPHDVPEISFDDSPRLDKLMRAGVIYLSLRDAIALALENNLDIEVARVTPKLSLANLQRANAGQLLRTVSSIIRRATSASLGVLAGANSLGSTGGGGTSSDNGILSGLNVQLAGSAIPNLDPVFFMAGQAGHTTNIETSTVVTGTTSLITSLRVCNTACSRATGPAQR